MLIKVRTLVAVVQAKYGKITAFMMLRLMKIEVVRYAIMSTHSTLSSSYPRQLGLLRGSSRYVSMVKNSNDPA